MIKHIVMWKLKEENKEENSKKMKELLENLNGKIHELKAVEVGINLNTSAAGMDVVLYTEFDNMEGLAIYQDHPEHLKVKDFVKEIAIDRKVVDFKA